MKTKLIAIFGIALYIFSVIISKSKDGVSVYPGYVHYIHIGLFTIFIALFSIYLWKGYKVLLISFYLCLIGGIVSAIMNTILITNVLNAVAFIIELIIIWKLWKANK